MAEAREIIPDDFYRLINWPREPRYWGELPEKQLRKEIKNPESRFFPPDTTVPERLRMIGRVQEWAA